MAEGRAGSAVSSVRREVLVLDLRDEAEAIARYDAVHRPGAVPVAVLESIRAAGIERMTIHRAGNRLVMLLEADARFDPAAKAAADAANPDVVHWEARMDALQQRLPFASDGEKWVATTCIFDLSEQPGAVHALEG